MYIINCYRGNNMKKRILSLLLATLMMALIVPINALADTIEVSNETELKNAISTIGTGTGTIKLKNDITLTNVIEFTGGTITLDLNGKTLKRNLTAATANGNVITLDAQKDIPLEITITGNGTISGGNNSGNGGNIAVFGDLYTTPTLSISNTTITNGRANYGGGIYVDSLSNLVIDGNTVITGNSATTNGGGIYMEDTSSVLTLKGNAKITSNTVNSSANNVYLPAGALIAVQEPGSNMSVGISMASYGSFTNTGITLEESWKDYFTSDDPHHAVDTFNIDSLRFRLVDAYAVTFDTDGGSAIDAQGVISGKTVNKPTDPTKEGYTFFRWLDKDGKPFVFSTPITEDITLKASWLMVTYSVKFYKCVGDETPFCFYNVSYNNTIGNVPNPTRKDCIFKGWYYNGKPIDFNTKVTCDMDVYAEWEAIAHDYKITEGAHALWLPKYAKGFLSFRSNADYSKFVSVEVDNKILDASKFIASPGSTIVKLKPEYLSTLAIGKHTLRIVSTDGYAETDFYIEDETIAPTDGGFLSEATMSTAFVGMGVVGLSAVFFELKKKKVR